MQQLTIDHLQQQIKAELEAAGATSAMAESTARALALAQAQGHVGHGLSRVAQYVTQLKNGRVNGQAQPTIKHQKGATLVIDADEGLAFPACDLAISEGIKVARAQGVALVGITNSHHCGVMVNHLRAAGDAGMIGLAFSNSPAAMPAPGGRKPLFGTNPIAALFPRKDKLPVCIDLSLSEVARGKVMFAAQNGQSIPAGWAVDQNGQPTTDAQAALAGAMLPIGALTSHKGALLAMVVELLVTTLVGANFGFQADSFVEAEGNRPRLGQLFILIDPGAMAGHAFYYSHLERLLTEMLEDPEVRLPGYRRHAIEADAQANGITLGN